MKKAKPTLKNIIAYIQGNLRYKLFYSNFAFLIRPHIREQIFTRIKSMDKKCYNEGQCKMCGCQTTHLQMANKACDKPCYPRMMSRKEWINFLILGYTKIDNIMWRLIKGKFENSEILFEDCEADIVGISRGYNSNGTFGAKIINIKKNNCKDE